MITQTRATSLPDIPRPAPGVPSPHVVANEGGLTLLYRTGGVDTSALTARVFFRQVYNVRWGPPNDERLGTHQLGRIGVAPYTPSELFASDWCAKSIEEGLIAGAEASEWLKALRHFVIPFHDSTFECLAGGYEVATLRSPLLEAVPDAARDIMGG
jgi:hypothetical protein